MGSTSNNEYKEKRTLLNVTEARASRTSYQLGASLCEENMTTGGSANGSAIETRRIGRVLNDSIEGRKALVETGSAKGSFADSAEANAAAGGSFQPRGPWVGRRVGKVGSSDCGTNSSCVPGVCEKSKA